MSAEEQVARGPASRGEVSPGLFAALRDRYGIRGGGVKDLGGSSNLNLLVTDIPDGADVTGAAQGRRRYVVRVYRPWVTAERLADMQLVRRRLASGGVPCVQPVSTLDGESWITVDGRLVVDSRRMVARSHGPARDRSRAGERGAAGGCRGLSDVHVVLPRRRR